MGGSVSGEPLPSVSPVSPEPSSVPALGYDWTPAQEIASFSKAMHGIYHFIP